MNSRFLSAAAPHEGDHTSHDRSKSVSTIRAMPLSPRLMEATLRVGENWGGRFLKLINSGSGGGLLISQPSNVTVLLPSILTAVAFTRSLLEEYGGSPRSLNWQPACMLKYSRSELCSSRVHSSSATVSQQRARGCQQQEYYTVSGFRL